MSDRKLQHSSSAIRCSLGMFSFQLFVFVEGKSDKFFYEKMCETIIKNRQYHIYTTKEFPHNIPNAKSDDKKSLLALFDYFNNESMLFFKFKEINKAMIFFMDKDVDDLFSKQIISEHVVYTQYYDIENHIFINGNIIEGVANAADKTTSEISQIIPKFHTWMLNINNQWKNYIKLCVFAIANEAVTKAFDKWECRYGKDALPKIFDDSIYKIVYDHDEYVHYSKLVEKLYMDNEYNKVFKGKWYIELLHNELKTRDSKTLFQCIRATLDFNAEWAEHFKQPLKKLTRKIWNEYFTD